MNASQLKKHKVFGSYAAIASACGVSREAVRKWKRIPLEHCASIEAASLGQITCELQRHDVKWLRDKSGEVIGYTITTKPSPRTTYSKAA